MFQPEVAVKLGLHLGTIFTPQSYEFPYQIIISISRKLIGYSLTVHVISVRLI